MVEHIVHSLLRRYGVVFWRLLQREAAWLPAWRDMLRVLRRLEARGDIRGGRFVASVSGEQFALPDAVTQAVQKQSLVVAAVLSGNRNFEGRINPLIKANYLASPPLVVAYALAGTMDIDLTTDPLGQDSSGQPVYLRDIWPTNEEVAATVRAGPDNTALRSMGLCVGRSVIGFTLLPLPALQSEP